MNEDDRKRLDSIESKVDDIKDNHLTHIYEVLGGLKGRWTIMIPLMVGIFLAIIGLYALIIRM